MADKALLVRKGSEVHIVWRGKQVEAEFIRLILAALRDTGAEQLVDMKQRLSIPTATSGPSKPGQYPHLDTGELVQKLFYRIDAKALELIIGSDAKHALYLEYGTRHMAPRPFLRRSINQSWTKLQKRLNHLR